MSAPSGFDWLSLPQSSGVEQSHTPPPPRVSFGISPNQSGVASPVIQEPSNHSEGPTAHTKRNDFNDLFANADSSRSSVALSDQSSQENIQLKEASRKEEEQILRNFKDDPSIALSLSIDQLTTKETKTYLRWYNDIITRRGTRTITLQDVFQFLNNFRIQDLHKKLINRIFASCAESLNIGQFFCLLRIISHATTSGKLPSRQLIGEASSIPAPVSILSRKRLNDTAEGSEDEDDTGSSAPKNDSTLNLDTFAQFMLTGQRPVSQPHSSNKRKNMKKVKFSDAIEIDPREDESPPAPAPPPTSDDKIDFSLPMEQLLSKVAPGKGVTVAQSSAPENEEEELKEMEDSINHFRNVNIDSVSIDGVPANIPSNYFSHSPMNVASPQRDLSPNPQSQPQLLQPNLTGSVSKSMRQGLGIASPPPPPPRMRATSSPIYYNERQSMAFPQSGGRSTSPSKGAAGNVNNTHNGNNNNNKNTSIDWRPAVTATSLGATPPPPPPSRFRSSTLPNHSPGSRSPVPPPPRPRSRKDSNPPPPSLHYTSGAAPELPPKIEITAPLNVGFNDYFKNGQVHKSSEDVSTSGANGDILSDLKALQAEVDKIKYMNRSNGF